MTPRRHASTTGAWRLVRGIAVGSCASAAGALAHVGGGGSAPPPGLLLMLGAAVTVGCGLASRWRWRLPSLVAVMLLAQLGFHLVLAGYAAPGAHAVHTALPSGHTDPEPAAPMAVGHIAAAVALALLLRFGETWLRAVVDALATRLLRLVEARPALPVGAPKLPVPTADTAVALSVHVRSTWSRGPPQEV